MTQTDHGAALSSLEHRVADLERAVDRGLSDRYARLYAPIAVVLVAMSALPPFNDIVDGDHTVSYGTLWDMARDSAGDPAVLGLLLLGALVALLVLAALRVPSPGRLVVIAALSALIILMLLTKPGTGEPTPELSGPATAGLVIIAGTAVLAVVHAVQLSSRRRR
jgi:hypothetical protein